MDEYCPGIFNGSNEEAVSAYDELLKIDPENITAWSRKALELQTLGRENESALAYGKALSLMEESLKKPRGRQDLVSEEPCPG